MKFTQETLRSFEDNAFELDSVCLSDLGSIVRFLAIFAARNDTLLVGAKHVLLFSSSQRLKKFGELSLLADKFIKFFKVLVSRRLGEVDNL